MLKGLPCKCVCLALSAGRTVETHIQKAIPNGRRTNSSHTDGFFNSSNTFTRGANNTWWPRWYSRSCIFYQRFGAPSAHSKRAFMQASQRSKKRVCLADVQKEFAKIMCEPHPVINHRFDCSDFRLRSYSPQRGDLVQSTSRVINAILLPKVCRCCVLQS